MPGRAAVKPAGGSGDAGAGLGVSGGSKRKRSPDDKEAPSPKRLRSPAPGDPLAEAREGRPEPQGVPPAWSDVSDLCCFIEDMLT